MLHRRLSMCLILTATSDLCTPYLPLKIFTVLTVSEADEDVCLKVNKDKGKDAAKLLKMLYAWKEQADKLSSEEISQEEYDNWRYHHPKFDTTQICAKVPSQELCNASVETFKDHLTTDK